MKILSIRDVQRWLGEEPAASSTSAEVASPANNQGAHTPAPQKRRKKQKTRTTKAAESGPAVSSVGQPAKARELQSSSDNLRRAKRRRVSHNSEASQTSRQAANTSLRNTAESAPVSDSDFVLANTIAYISFTSNSYTTNEEHRKAMEVLQEAREANADVINIAFERTADINILWNDIETEMKGYFSRRQGSLITFFSESCGELVSDQSCGELVSDQNVDTEPGVPSICLTFSGPAGRMIIINAHWPQLSRKTKARMLGEYFTLAMEQMLSVHMIGGFLDDLLQKVAPFFLENSFNYTTTPREDLCVLTKTCGLVSYTTFPLKSSVADTLVFHFWRGHAAEPSATKSDPVSVEPPHSDGSVTNSDPVNADSAGCAAEPSATNSDAVSVGSLTLRPQTPLCDKFFENLEWATESSGNAENEQELLKFIHKECFFRDLCYKNCNGDDVKMPIPMSLKMEDLLEAAEKRRQLALDHLRKCGKLDTFSLAGNHYSTHQMEENDMKEMYNRWRRDIHSWMNENTLTGYRNLKRAGCHSTAQAFVKTAFNTYLVQLSGSRFLLDKLIQLPMVQRPGSLLLSGSAERLLRCSTLQ